MVVVYFCYTVIVTNCEEEIMLLQVGCEEAMLSQVGCEEAMLSQIGCEEAMSECCDREV
jgi:hypothetical protein